MQERQFDPWVRKIPWRMEWQPTPVFLPGESHGQRSLAGYREARDADAWMVRLDLLPAGVLPQHVGGHGPLGGVGVLALLYLQGEARTQLESSPRLPQLEKSLCSNEDPAQMKIINSNNFLNIIKKYNYIIPSRSFLCVVVSLKSILKRKHDFKHSYLIHF